MGGLLTSALEAGGFDVTPLSRGDNWQWPTSIDQRVRSIVHLAARAHVMRDNADDPLRAYRQANVGATRRLAEGVAASGIGHFVFVSSAKVLGESTPHGKRLTERDAPNPRDPYAQSKWEAEGVLKEYEKRGDFRLTIVRPPLVYGRGVKGNVAALARWIDAGRPLPLGSITRNQRSMIAVENLVSLLVHCVGHSGASVGGVFMASDGKTVSTAEFAKCLAVAMDRPTRLINVPVPLLKAGAAVFGRRTAIARLTESFVIDDSYTRSRLGWRPNTTMHASLALMARSLKESQR